ncbi:MAG: hypothetical protein AB8G14_05110 [Ilumatobacter sp.]
MTNEVSPWASDDIPVSSGTDAIVWDTAEQQPDAPLAPTHRRRWPGVAALAAVASLGAIALVAWPSSDSNTELLNPVDSVAPPTLDALPPVTTTPPPTTVATPASQSPIAVSTAPNPLPLTEVEVPDRVASAGTNQLVILTADGRLVTIDLPSGIVTEIDLQVESGQRFGDDLVVAAPDATMVSTSSGAIVVVDAASGVTVSIDPDDFAFDSSSRASQVVPFGWIRDADGRSVFLVIAVENDTGRQRELLVDTDGLVTPAPAQRAGTFSTPVFAQGSRFLNDAGGAYRVDPDGSVQRVSNGEILASSATRLLLRECDAQRNCTNIVRDYDGNDVTVVNLPPGFSPTFFGGSLSPDATAVATPSGTFNGRRSLFDLANDTSFVFEDQRLGPFGNTWTADSSGEFSIGDGPGVLLLDRSTGDTVVFAEQVGTIRAIAVRAGVDQF